jgi:CRISPR-associated endonuclease/helicase Cas3
VLPLAGKRLELDGHSVHVGVPSVLTLTPASALRSRIVVIKGFTEAEPFREAARRQLDAMHVKARVEVGRRRVLTVAGDIVVGFEVTLHDLDEEGSLKLQYAGIGGRQRMGCGIFVPLGGRASRAQ